jgi:hypothetical protein
VRCLNKSCSRFAVCSAEYAVTDSLMRFSASFCGIRKGASIRAGKDISQVTTD